jgi:hypothetical protein
MYLKKNRAGDSYHYVLSESYWNGELWTHRRLLDLGPHPEKYIEYPGGNSFYIKETLVDALSDMGKGDTTDALEEILRPFLDPRIRRIIERFERPKNPVKKWREACSKNTLLAYQRNLHPFDKRRLHYLRFGRIRIGDLDARPRSFLYVLFEKSRDEIEHLIEEMERDLPPHELHPYLYTALRLQDHFRHLLTRYHPSAMDPEKLDKCFLDALCRLNEEEMFLRGVPHSEQDCLHPYLVKYLILYFDHSMGSDTVGDEYVSDFIWRHRFHRNPRASQPATSQKTACRILGISLTEFQQMDRQTLARRYRRLAKKTHPDRGGDKALFVKIKSAYEDLLKLK